MKTPRSDQSKTLLYLLDQEAINMWRIDKTKKFDLEVVNGEEITRKIKVNITKFVQIYQPQVHISGDKNVFLPPGTGRVPFTWEFYFLLSGRKRRVKVSILRNGALFLKSAFNSKKSIWQICHIVRIFWHSVFLHGFLPKEKVTNIASHLQVQSSYRDVALRIFSQGSLNPLNCRLLHSVSLLLLRNFFPTMPHNHLTLRPVSLGLLCSLLIFLEG